ncbi:bifunctional phosphopantothenoylcysteine decarboxylase/phosphopantothenate--cysteine ligase CoaBC [Desulfovibrio inopinatus]|uniref:bifunctional phosphopantothenoylcysteine decarboxylase/phosphopantothenate--cysteine ligase CoaBC n=1 Tax=Desulfovibrio inopinatus TaxID=102109 RepID=UPI0003FE2080|nr:bifunctional phosphopantothenoylcysteine decarboxylase/phosphopantothenate--cysteine ligase CoaBC [Desulfovibrio inopinatus]
MSDNHLTFTGFLGKRIHIGICGSVAACAVPSLLRRLLETEAGVGATLTASGERFLPALTLRALGADPVYTTLFDHEDAVFGHLAPGESADCLLIAPATANILAKMAHGLADDMLSTQALSFNRSIVVAPAMNPRMWDAPATQANWQTLRDRGVIGVDPEVGRVACGDTGQGRLADSRRILMAVLRAMAPKYLEGKKIFLTLGPTREYFDPVRFWSNPSSGTMGGALAVAAWMLGAHVTVASGPVDMWLPDGITVHKTPTAQAMYEAAMDTWPAMDMACLCAAVADFSPVAHGASKFKKESASADNGLTVHFNRTKDILQSLGDSKKTHQKLIGFCAETDDLEKQAEGKLRRKHCDLIVGNDITRPDAGFGVATNRVFVLDAKGRAETWPTLAKTEVAWRIWEWIAHL